MNVSTVSLAVFLVLTTAQVDAETEPLGHGAWWVVRSVDPITDARRVMVVLSDDAKLPGPWNQTLGVVCEDGETRVGVTFDKYLSLVATTAEIEIRFPPAPARREIWGVSKKLIAPFSKDKTGLLIEISHSHKLVIRAHVDDDQATAVFDLTGSWEAVKIIAGTCGWTLAPPVEEDKEDP